MWSVAKCWGEAVILFNIPPWAFPAYWQKVSNAGATRSRAFPIYFKKFIPDPLRTISIKNSDFIITSSSAPAFISPT